MSHLKEREDKNCLNCNAIVHGKYCHICGQENIHPKETLLHLISHFFQDITHFDGKFFSSLGLLIRKPGYISREYMMGRRASYLNPIRMYVFTSAIFFIIFFSMAHIGDGLLKSNKTLRNKSLAQIEKMDSVDFSEFTAAINFEDSNIRRPMSRAEFKNYFESQVDSGRVQFTPVNYDTKEEYDSALASGKKKHNWVMRQLVYKQIALNEKYKGNQGKMLTDFSNTLIHSIPQLLFVTLPLFAWLLHIMYRRRRQYYYVNHAIFTIHFFVFVFIILLIIFGLKELSDLLHWNWLKYLRGILVFYIFYYCYKAMRNFYQQGRAKTIIKFVILHLANLFFILILFIFSVFFSLFKI